MSHKTFRNKGIHHETSCVGTPNQNGRAERKHRHILNVARALRFQANLPIKFWGECILTAGYLINRTPSSVLHGETPYQRLYNTPPPYHHIRTFGSLCYAHNQLTKGDKFASKSRRCVFIGYPHGQKGWRLFDLDKRDFFVSRDVIFRETEFPYAEVLSTTENGDAHSQLGDPSNIASASLDIDDSDVVSPTIRPPQITTPSTEPTVSDESNHDPAPTPSSSDRNETSSETNQPTNDSTPSSPQPQEVTSVVLPPTDSSDDLGRGKRQKFPSVILQPYVTRLVNTRLLTSNYPITSYIKCARFSASHRAYQVAVLSAFEPTTFEQAVLDECWNHAMSDEIKAQELNKTWTITSLPPVRKLLGANGYIS